MLFIVVELLGGFIMRTYQKENLFPYEAFIKEAIKRYFEMNGFQVADTGQVDLIAENMSTSEKWVIEAKGMTSAIGLDFNTCLGQLLKSINSDEIHYAIAIPKIEKYKKQCEKISDYVRKKINLNIILVDEKSNIEIIAPADCINEHF
jgi:hypothetical protein